MTERELVVVDDVAEEALGIFLVARPRTVLLTGGETPRALYERLAEVEYDWSVVECFFSDERCVPAGDERSNARMAEEALLRRVEAVRWHAIDGAACDADRYERTLRDRLGDDARFDLALYGLGPDGHTASLFPGRPEVEESARWVVRVPDAGWEPFVPRVSLTVPLLSSASLGLFLVSGESKREPLRRLLAAEDIPATRMAPERCVVIADHAAAA